MRTVLVLGGTSEARALAAALDALPGVRVVSSLAGRVRDPALPAGRVRVGGFGGPEGLASWLDDERVHAVVDATHPFAARISGNAAIACAASGVPLLLLRRPGWTEGPGDRWHRVPSVAAAADLLPHLLSGSDGRVFLTTGRGDLDAFADLDGHFLIRTVDPPDPPLPRRHRVLLDRGPYTVDGERAVLEGFGAQVLVTKDSGGDATRAKLVAARLLALPVVVVDRPAPPAGVRSVETVRAVLDWLDGSEDRRPSRPT